eukprot:749706-Hanusia_phi.AAC.1
MQFFSRFAGQGKGREEHAGGRRKVMQEDEDEEKKSRRRNEMEMRGCQEKNRWFELSKFAATLQTCRLEAIDANEMIFYHGSETEQTTPASELSIAVREKISF